MKSLKPPARPLNRRAFLKASSVASAVTTGALCGPAWLRDAFALNERQAPKATDSLATLSTAYRAAERAGKPLVILLIPEDPMARWERGTLFGEYLTQQRALSPQTIAAYRDRYGIAGTSMLGAQPENEAQRSDANRARAAAERATQISRSATPEAARESPTTRSR